LRGGEAPGNFPRGVNRVGVGGKREEYQRRPPERGDVGLKGPNMMWFRVICMRISLESSWWLEVGMPRIFFHTAILA